ncbi:diguanylate cyclase [bacterium]|nr:diguanylate cyclase [bacterium]
MNESSVENKEIKAEKSETVSTSASVEVVSAQKTVKKPKTKKSGSKSGVIKMISTPVKPSLPPTLNMSAPAVQNTDDIVNKINNFNTTKTSNRLYAGYINNTINSTKVIDYADLINQLNNGLRQKSNVQDLFNTVYSILSDRTNCLFLAFGLFHEKSKCINLKLLGNIGSTYSSKVFLSDTENPIIECFSRTEVINKDSNDFLNIPYLRKSPVIILPMISLNKCVGVMLIGKENTHSDIGLYSFIANYCALFVHNAELVNQTSLYANTDTLTSLYNHRGFQERLSGELEKAKVNNTKLSIVMLDVNNISKINRELGHAKGDEVIKLVADKIKQNMRSNDIAGRYGGDEIAIILPETDTTDAKYLAEYFTYTLSCCFVDDVGPVKVSVGIATYPECSTDQEKLLILAEQAMYISQAKGYKEGMSAIISSADFNFWADEALESFAAIIAKRHSQLGVNFEEELVHKFNNEQIISQNHLMEMATSLAGAIDAKDPYTKDHSTSVSRYSEALARALNLPESEVQRITLGALLHDVGKIGIPENVLKKPGKLDDNEWEIMKQHPSIGAEKVLAPNEALRDLIPIVKYHHERVDGNGYPEKLKGDEIPLAARIVAVADAYHALISDRPYRKGMAIQKACEILQEGAGKIWDTELVRHFISIAPSLAASI